MWKTILAMGLALGMAALGGEPRPPGEVSALRGELLYGRYCFMCHGANGEGDGPIAWDLRTSPADLSTIAQRHGGLFPEAKIAQIIDGRERLRSHGEGDMPAWGRWLAEDGEAEARAQIRSLVEYLKTIQKPAPPRN